MVLQVPDHDVRLLGRVEQLGAARHRVDVVEICTELKLCSGGVQRVKCKKLTAPDLKCADVAVERIHCEVHLTADLQCYPEM